jgi:hypothetical protein
MSSSKADKRVISPNQATNTNSASDSPTANQTNFSSLSSVSSVSPTNFNNQNKSNQVKLIKINSNNNNSNKCDSIASSTSVTSSNSVSSNSNHQNQHRNSDIVNEMKTSLNEGINVNNIDFKMLPANIKFELDQLELELLEGDITQKGYEKKRTRLLENYFKSLSINNNSKSSSDIGKLADRCKTKEKIRIYRKKNRAENADLITNRLNSGELFLF